MGRSGKLFTHFLAVNMDTNEMVDSLKKPDQIRVEPLTYTINQFRVFDGVKFQPNLPPPVLATPAVPTIPAWGQPTVDRAKAAGITTPLTRDVAGMKLWELLAVIDKYNSVSSPTPLQHG